MGRTELNGRSTSLQQEKAMTSGQHKKIRYVKCPKCSRILPEPEQIPLYTCGGCGTILRAKYYKKQTETVVPTLPTVNTVQSNDNGHASEVGKSSDSSQRSPDEHSSIQNGVTDEKAVDDCNSNQIGDDISAHHTSLSEESTAQDKEVEQLSPTEIGTREDGSDQDQCDGIAVEKQDDDQIVNVNYASETSTENEAKQVENDKQEQCEDIAIEKPEELRHENYKNQASTMIPSQLIETPMKLERVNVAEGSKISVNEANSLAEDKVVGVSKLGKDDKIRREQKSFIERIREKLASVTISNDSPKSTEVEDGNENSLPVAEASLDASASRSASAPSIANERIASDVVPQDADSELSLLDNVEETLVENSETFDNPAFNESEQNRHSSNAKTVDPLDTHEKGSDSVKEISRSPIKESLAYDGSVSSCDGNDDQVPGELEHLNSGNGVSGCVGAEENSTSQRRSGQLSDEREKQRSILEERESIRENEIRGSNRTRQHRDSVFPPRVPSHRKSSEIAFETGSSSSYVNDEPPSKWTRNHPYGYEEQEQFRRITYDQRRFMEGRRFRDAPWRENDVLPTYRNDEMFSGEFYEKQRYHGYSDGDVKRRAGNRFLSCNLPRTDYSGEVYGRGYQVHSGEVHDGRYLMKDHYMDRYPDPRQRSAQLPPGGRPRYREEPMTYMDPSRETRWDPYDDPYPTNPRRLYDFESYGLGHDRAYLSDDQRHGEWIMRRSYVKEKRQVAKRHFRPMAGGAPFITCHFCFKVLQLPEEFLVFKRRKIHMLKCGVCSNILKFSLENDSCLAPRLPFSNESEKTELDLPQDNSFGALGREKSNSRNAARVDESSDGGNNAASSSVESRQMKVTWHLPARTKSPLHQLLGYSSAEDLLAAHTVDDKE